MIAGEVFRIRVPIIGLLQIINIQEWSEGYSPPRIQKGKGDGILFFHLVIKRWQIRFWRTVKHAKR